MSDACFIPSEAIAPWLVKIGEDARVFATQHHDQAVIFKEFDKEDALVLNRESVSSAKGSAFPQSLPFFFYKNSNRPGAEGGDKAVDVKPLEENGPIVVFGARPCGAKGFQTFDRVFTGVDPYYARLRKNTAFITLACDRPGSTCFCHWVDGGPGDTWGSDILLIPVGGGDGYVARTITERGEELLGLATCEPAGDRDSEADAVVERARQALGSAQDLTGIADALEDAFSDLDFWDEMTAGCSGCGVCTYLCPTCYCFNITDESDGVTGVRLRTWDSCMFHQYTQEASGHNPRPSKAHRMRNRVGHKFWYHPSRFEQEISCCGCGRCVKHCPGAVDIRHILKSALRRFKED